VSADLLVVAALTGLAAYRLWQIVGRDQIGDPIRVWLIGRDSRFWMVVGDLLGCAWCLGWWLSGVIAVVALWGAPLLHVGLVWCAGSVVAGFLGEIDDVLSRKAEQL